MTGLAGQFSEGTAALPAMALGQLNVCMQSREGGPLPPSIHKHQLLGRGLRTKAETIKRVEENTGVNRYKSS